MSKVEFTSGNWNPFESLRDATPSSRSNAGIAAGPGGLSKRQHQRAMEMLDKHHANVMEHLGASYGHETQFQTHLSGLREQEAGGQHSRNLEFFKTTSRGAQGGTSYKTNMPGGYSLEMTTKQKAPRKPKQTATPAFPPVKMPEEPQAELPTSSNPATTSGATVGRDPKTGRATSLKGSSSQPPKQKKSSTSGPSVKRNPKTGRAQSLKRQ